MGSHPTLDSTTSRPPDTDRNPSDRHRELLEHLHAPNAGGGHDFGGWPVHQLAANLGGDLTTLHDLDHTYQGRSLGHRHPQPDPTRQAERAFDRLNPEFGVPADRSDRIGHHAQQREAALVLGVRVAVHDSRQNDRDPVIWQPGQDYRAADALHAARQELVRARHGPERTGPER